MQWLDRVVEIRDRLRVTRTVTLGFTLWLSWHVYSWVMEAIDAGTVTEEWMAAAILGPISALQAAVFKFYSDYHKAGQ